MGTVGGLGYLDSSSMYCSESMDEETESDVSLDGAAVLPADNPYLQNNWTPQKDFHLIRLFYEKVNARELSNLQELRTHQPIELFNRHAYIFSTQGEPYLWILLTNMGWTISQDRDLVFLAKTHSNNWEQVANFLNRSERVCEERWCFLMTLKRQIDATGVFKDRSQDAIESGYDDLNALPPVSPPKKPLENRTFSRLS